MAQYAQDFSRVLGRTIQYVNVPPQIWETRLREARLPDHLIAHLITMGELHREAATIAGLTPSSNWSAVPRFPLPNSPVATLPLSRLKPNPKRGGGFRMIS
jgi:hypothetical protein